MVLTSDQGETGKFAMVPASHLRIYKPLADFSDEDRLVGVSTLAGPAARRASGAWRHVDFEGHSLGILRRSEPPPALVKEYEGTKYVCPQRTRVQTLVGLLTARATFPLEVADDIVPEEAAAQAAVELESMRSEAHRLRSFVSTAPWHVPLRWFIAFTDDEREVLDTPEGPTIRYLTKVPLALERVQSGIGILEEAEMADVVVDPVRELGEWLQDFEANCLLELDYGEVASLFSAEDLVLDHSGAEVWTTLEALKAGDWEESSRRYAELAEKWGRARSVGTTN